MQMSRCAPRVVRESEPANDALARLECYLQQHLPAFLADRVPSRLETLRRDVQANRKTDIYCLDLLQGLPASDRAEAEALVGDIRVLLLQRRTQLLRDARAGSLTRQDLGHLFQDVCLAIDPPLDPDLPKTAAQAILHRSSQKDLIMRLSAELDRVRQEISVRQQNGSLSGGVLLPLGRLLAFLRWVPHDWAEEIALEILDTVALSNPADRLRLWVSVLRVFFCRPSVTATSVDRLLAGIEGEFGWPAPMELRNLVRTVLIRGGEKSQRALLRRFDERPETYETVFFLDHLAMINKPVAAARLLAHKDSLIARFGVESYLALLTRTGEITPAVHALLAGLWDQGQAAARLQCLEAIEDLHYAEMAPFLLSRLDGEDNPALRCRLVETVAASAGNDDLRSLAACVREDRSVIRYYTMHLIHRRLLDTPELLAMQQDLSVLKDLQDARGELYGIYQSLLCFRRALANGPENAGAPGAGPTGSGVDPHGRGGRPAPPHPPDRAQRLADALAVLNGRDLMLSRIRTNIFGVIDCGRLSGDLLERGDVDAVVGGKPIPDDERHALVARTERSIAFLLDVFLWQEWFVREIPFVLSEEIESLVDRVRRGDSLNFSLGTFSGVGPGNDLHNIFEIFCECTRHGLYLTDVLLAHVLQVPREQWFHVLRHDLTGRRIMVADGRLEYRVENSLDRHLQFTTFAHDYRYGKESLEQPSLMYLWLRYMAESRRILAALAGGAWPVLPPHPDVPDLIGPLTRTMYDQHAREAERAADFIMSLYARAERDGMELRVIPNLTYGLFCLAPVLDRFVQRGIHVSLAGVSSQFCDDENINRFTLRDENVFPLKRYLFSNASNYGTLNGDRILVVVDGTMEPVNRHDATKVRLPKAYRGFVNHMAAVNYVRARYGYKMENPEREVASALNLPLLFVRNLLRTYEFRHLLDGLLLCFDPEALDRSHAAAGTGKTYYTFAQWNPDGMPAWIGPIGYPKCELPCSTVEDTSWPSLVFVSMNSIFNETGVAAFFDNDPEVEHPRMYVGPQGVKIDIGWPGCRMGIEVQRGP